MKINEYLYPHYWAKSQEIIAVYVLTEEKSSPLSPNINVVGVVFSSLLTCPNISHYKRPILILGGREGGTGCFGGFFAGNYL